MVVAADDHAHPLGLLVLNATPDLRVLGEAATMEEAHTETLAKSPRAGARCRHARQGRVPTRHRVASRSARHGMSWSSQAACRIDSSSPHVRLGAKGYVAKIDRTDAVIDAIRAIAKGQTYFSSTVQTRIVFEDASRRRALPRASGSRIANSKCFAMSVVASPRSRSPR